MNWLTQAQKFTTSLSSIRGSLYDGEITKAQAVAEIQAIRTAVQQLANKHDSDTRPAVRFRQVVIDSMIAERSLDNIQFAYIS